jgi:hypothetical protein
MNGERRRSLADAEYDDQNAVDSSSLPLPLPPPLSQMQCWYCLVQRRTMTVDFRGLSILVECGFTARTMDVAIVVGVGGPVTCPQCFANTSAQGKLTTRA